MLSFWTSRARQDTLNRFFWRLPEKEMDFSDAIAALSQRIGKQRDGIDTEEATKTAFVLPFISALGYDVFDPTVVIPEFTADVGVKKGEKVDYVIRIGGKVSILIECKPCKSTLCQQHTSQLYRYFSVTEARFSILTNGVVYWFFSDLDQNNIMDAKPFFEFDILNYRPAQLEELKKFSIDSFDVPMILATASDLKYGGLLTREIAKEIDSPSDELTKILISRVYDGNITANILNKFRPLVQRAARDAVRELLNQRLNSAIDDTSRTALSTPQAIPAPQESESQGGETGTISEIVTTQDEIDGYYIIRAIVREVVAVSRVVMRDSKSYCAILLDDNNRKPICRLHLNRSVWYLSLFDEEKNEERVKLSSLDDIFSYGDRLKKTVLFYEKA